MLEHFKNLLIKELKVICDDVEVFDEELRVDYNGVIIFIECYNYKSHIEVRLDLSEVTYGGKAYTSEEIPYWIEEDISITSENDFESAICDIVSIIEDSTEIKRRLGRLIRIVQSIREEYTDYSEIKFIKEML